MTTQTFTDISAKRNNVLTLLQELWDYRSLLLKMTWRTLKIRYKQTAIGLVWAVAQPFLMMLVYTVVFSFILNRGTSDVPYPLFVFTNLAVFAIFSDGLTSTVVSVVQGSALYQKIYFPRIIVPISAGLTTLFDHLLALVVVFIMLLGYGFPLRWQMLLLPVISLLPLTMAMGLGLALGAINVRFRDIQNLLPIVTRILFFLTPIVYPITIAEEPLRSVLKLNPLYAYVQGFGWSMLGQPSPELGYIAYSVGITLIFLLAGLWVFARTEWQFAEIV